MPVPAQEACGLQRQAMPARCAPAEHPARPFPTPSLQGSFALFIRLFRSLSLNGDSFQCWDSADCDRRSADVQQQQQQQQQAASSSGAELEDCVFGTACPPPLSAFCHFGSLSYYCTVLRCDAASVNLLSSTSPSTHFQPCSSCPITQP